ncbi:tRNA (adenosine(37)-N6)-threonylcarbamoyltransferase complex ATPase subunit type 1 TsaE [Algoriphagus hitonicola]|uniref:tRNA threonylcarbamoyladenosine biosynthesis protein TsaE n=1 Tax=Algoriphagus hitonicola TaxID=435880 RepID=A0A1I2SQU8_9BACT|nr:tRNA (adenosine(37)-N6)-threonylcarbamoyltransferase complex ATPase subunit type 1 TsaE [Algoriphagus hitonicola]SFG55244.1 tRNA threonylcarbamoyladenosine biosynthesis protein TsaE [Algoriphagus hitonicola]
MVEKTYQLQELDAVAEELVAAAQEERIWVFQGQMGAGKTTLIKALCRQFQVKDAVSSPTFGIVNQYETEDHQLIYHFDFYRIVDPLEVLEIGVEEYFYSGNYCWIEWAENLGGFIPQQFFLIKLEVISADKRKITYQHIDYAHGNK